MFPVRANGETFRETTMFPQQCFLVCEGLRHAGSAGLEHERSRGKHEPQASVFPYFLSALAAS